MLEHVDPNTKLSTTSADYKVDPKSTLRTEESTYPIWSHVNFEICMGMPFGNIFKYRCASRIAALEMSFRSKGIACSGLMYRKWRRNCCKY